MDHAVLDMIEDLSTSETPAEAYDAARALLVRQGVSFVNYAYLNTETRGDSNEGLDFWTNMPLSWMEAYAREGMVSHDYTVRRTLTNPTLAPVLTGADYVRDTPGMRPGEPNVLYAARECINLRAAFAGRLPDMTPARATGFLLAIEMPRRDTLSLVRERGGLFVLSMMALHERMGTLRRRDAATARPALSPRERTVLQGTARGETQSRIGERLHMAESTVGVHLANIRRKVGARTSDQAVVKAILDGLVEP